MKTHLNLPPVHKLVRAEMREEKKAFARLQTLARALEVQVNAKPHPDPIGVELIVKQIGELDDQYLARFGLPILPTETRAQIEADAAVIIACSPANHTAN